MLSKLKEKNADFSENFPVQKHKYCIYAVKKPSVWCLLYII